MTADRIDTLLRASGLPSPVGVILDAMRHVDTDEAGIFEFAETIAGDAALAASVLRFANARQIGAAPITVRDAITRIGPRAARVVALSHILVSTGRDLAGAQEALMPVWRRGLARAIIARRLCQHLDPRRAGEVFQAAALADLSLVALYAVNPEECRGVLSATDRAGAERAAFGVSAAEASAELLKHWRVPRRLWNPIRALSGEKNTAQDNVGADSAQSEVILRAAEAITGAVGDPGGFAALDSPMISGLSIDPALLRTLVAAAAEEFSHRRVMLEGPGGDREALTQEARSRAQATLAELSLATQLENRVMLRRQQELMRRVTTDSLTQIKNRLAFDERLGEEFERCQRTGKPLALFLVDLDHFKQFNDQHGHQAGDLMLRTAAAALANAARRVDMVARYGGEEFVVIAPDCGPEGAIAVAERLRLSIAETPAEWRSHTFRCTASIGGAVLAPGGPQPTPSELVAAADRLLYAAKRAGRNRAIVEVFRPDAAVETPRAGRSRSEVAQP